MDLCEFSKLFKIFRLLITRKAVRVNKEKIVESNCFCRSLITLMLNAEYLDGLRFWWMSVVVRSNPRLKHCKFLHSKGILKSQLVSVLLIEILASVSSFGF